MAASTHPNLPISYDWLLGETYKSEMDDNLILLGAIPQLSVISQTTNEPVSPANGDRYIHNGDGSWSVGSAGDVVLRIGGAWRAYTPNTGWRTYVEDEDETYLYDISWIRWRPHRRFVGTYVGDGTTANAITGLNFSPIKVKISREEATPGTAVDVFETTTAIIDDDAAGGALKSAGAGGVTFENTAIVSLDADGFTVQDAGTDSDPNTNGVTYNYEAWG